MAERQPCKMPFELVDRVRQHLEKEPPYLHKFREMIDTFFTPSLDDLDRKTLPDLQELTRIFGLVFFGAHFESVAFKWDWDLYDDREKDLGITQEHEGKRITISLFPDPLRFEGEREMFASPSDAVLSILLHECVHAYLRTQGCSHGQCGSAACRRHWHEQVGNGGHGDAFLRLSALVEAYARRHGLWSCELDGETTALKHWEQNRRVPDQETVRLCWPVEIVSIEGDVLYWRRR